MEGPYDLTVWNPESRPDLKPTGRYDDLTGTGFWVRGRIVVEDGTDPREIHLYMDVSPANGMDNPEAADLVERLQQKWADAGGEHGGDPQDLDAIFRELPKLCSAWSVRTNLRTFDPTHPVKPWMEPDGSFVIWGMPEDGPYTVTLDTNDYWVDPPDPQGRGNGKYTNVSAGASDLIFRLRRAVPKDGRYEVSIHRRGAAGPKARIYVEVRWLGRACEVRQSHGIAFRGEETFVYDGTGNPDPYEVVVVGMDGSYGRVGFRIEPEQTTRVDLDLAPGAAVRGRLVRTSTRDPIPGVYVLARVERRMEGAYGNVDFTVDYSEATVHPAATIRPDLPDTAITGADGAFSLSSLPDGESTIYAYDESRPALASVKIVAKAGAEVDLGTVVVDDGAWEEVDGERFYLHIVPSLDRPDGD